MPSRSASLPKYRHHKGSGQAFVQIRGHRHYLGVWGSPKSKERYSRFVAELAVSIAAAPAPPSATPASPITVVELCAAYLDFAEEYYRRHGKPTRYLDDIKLAMRPFKQLYGTAQVTSFWSPGAAGRSKRAGKPSPVAKDDQFNRWHHQANVQVGRLARDRSAQRLPCACDGRGIENRPHASPSR